MYHFFMKSIRAIRLLVLLAAFGFDLSGDSLELSACVIPHAGTMQPSIVCDELWLLAFGYDPAPKLPTNKNNTRAMAGSGPLAEFAEFLAAETTAVQMTGKYAWGNDVYMSFQTSKGAVGVSGELVPNGSQLLLKDVAIYPEGADRLNIGFSQVAQIRDAVAAEAEAQGYTSLRITGQRFSGANYGKPIDITIQLGKH